MGSDPELTPEGASRRPQPDPRLSPERVRGIFVTPGTPVAALHRRTVGISGWQEFAGQVKAGQLRLIGISAPERVEGIDGPTLKEQGVDVVLPTWRGLVAPADIKGKDLETLSAAVDKMVKSDAWQKVLKERGWLDLYMPRAEFKPS